VLLDAGLQSMRLVMDTNSSPGLVANFNWIQVNLTLSNNPPSVALTSPPDQATLSAPATIRFQAEVAGDHIQLMATDDSGVSTGVAARPAPR
jgi:hypothetical protein